MSFEVKLIFLIKPFFLHDHDKRKCYDKNLNILGNVYLSKQDTNIPDRIIKQLSLKQL